jgi:hypothetical protein
VKIQARGLLERRHDVDPDERVPCVSEALGQRVARELEDLRHGRRLAEERGGGLGQLVRLVEDDGVRGREQIGDAFLAQCEVGEEEMMVDDDDVGIHRRAPRLDDEAAVVVSALRAEARVAGRRHETPDRRVLRHVGEIGAVAGLRDAREPLDRAKARRVLPRRQAAALLGAGEMFVAQVVRAALEQRDGHRRRERGAHERDVLAKELVLQRLRAGR